MRKIILQPVKMWLYEKQSRKKYSKQQQIPTKKQGNDNA